MDCDQISGFPQHIPGGSATGRQCRGRSTRTRYRITLSGVVQGVGFRPFVKRLADRFGFPGIAFNTASGLIVEVESRLPGSFERFLAALSVEAPAAARIASCQVEQVIEQVAQPGGLPVIEKPVFEIVPSLPRDQGFTLVPPDLGTCADCLAEINDPASRRFQYAFTNCTSCGPRYSITLATPYDRANTTMRGFPLCADCRREYEDPADRRFHAEPIACPGCGPQLSVPIEDIRAALERNEVVALKGLGGYQLACRAFSSEAVERLRLLKRRSRKPFAVMMGDLATVQQYCFLNEPERRTLKSSAAPILLLKMRESGLFPDAVAPGLAELGVMLPYTPLHHLLFAGSLRCLVMTSGNISEEPIVTGNQEAQQKLSPLANRVVTHDRDIFMRVDDSTARVFEGVPRLLRRARGYAPAAIPLHSSCAEVLGVGAELKNTFCLTKDRFAILSQHIGDLENYETLQFFEETLANLESVYQAHPRLIAHDLHPDALSTRWALARPQPKLAVQHHHAHIASCMAENGLFEKVIGVAFDGNGYGSDGQVWGGEFLLCDYHGFERCAHLRYVPLPGGDMAARQGWRMAAAHLFDALGENFRDTPLACWQAVPPAAWNLLPQMLRAPALRTSSCGRLFDAVASLCGISHQSSYEGESAMLLEAAAARETGPETYPIDLDTTTDPWTIDTRPLLRHIVQALARSTPSRTVAHCFHNSVAHIIEVACCKLRERTGVDKVCLSGGTFQNSTLLARVAARLGAQGLAVYLHSQVPPNDGGLSLGQAVIAASLFERM